MTCSQMTWFVLGATVPGMIVCWAAAWPVRQRGPRWGLVDRPGERKVHTQPVPTAGGLAIWLGVVLPFAVGPLLLPGLVQQSGQLWTLLAGGTALMVLGLADDRWGLDWRIRLGLQTLVAVVLVVMQPQWRLSLFIDVPLLTGTLSVVWIVGLVNSFNMLDNMDGLSAGVAAIAAAMLAAVMLLAPDPVTGGPQLFVAGLLLVLVGSLAGFLWHNRPPARLFMGDAGSYLVGYLLAMATLRATFAGDRSHFSHRLVQLGMTPGQAVLTIYLATATCGLGALLLHQVTTAGACIILLLVGCILLLIGILETAGRRRRSGDQENDPHGKT